MVRALRVGSRPHCRGTPRRKSSPTSRMRISCAERFYHRSGRQSAQMSSVSRPYRSGRRSRKKPKAARWRRAASRSSVGGDHAGLGRAEFGEDVAALVADEGVAVEDLAAFVADPVGGDDRDDVGDGVADHRPAPHARLVSRSGSCGSVPIAVGKSRISAPISISERAVSGYHWSQQMPTPSVPARRRPGLEAGIAGAEVEFLGIARAVGDVALAVDAHHRALVVDHGEAVIMMRPVRLEEAGRDVDFELGGELAHRQHGGMASRPAARWRTGPRPRSGRNRGLRTIRAAAPPWRPGRGLADQRRDVADILVDVVAEGELERGDC